MTRKIILILLLSICSSLSAFAQKQKALSSPDGHIVFTVSNHPEGLSYTISLNNKTIIENSPLNISIDQKVLTRQVKIGRISTEQADNTYPWYGAHAIAVNRYKGMTIALRDLRDQEDYQLEVRAFDNGIGFRWIIPGKPDQQRIPDEATAFQLPKGSTVWYHDLRMHYEGVHVKKNIDGVQDSEWAAPPLTVKLPDNEGYAVITEADLVDYSGMALQANGHNGFVLRLAQHQPVSYPYELRYSKEDVKKSQEPAAVKGTITTPWRVILIGADLNTIVNSDVVHNLCPPPDKKLFPDGIHTDWVQPGRAVWKYLDGGGPGTLDNMKHFSKLAAQLGFQYNILEGFWARWPDDSIRALVNYSKKLGVGIWVWKHSKELRDPQARQAFFQHCHDLGITGVKIDFFDSEAKSVIDLYTDILKETATQHLLVDFHGSDKPTGLSRTWPNELNREAVKGMESRSIKDRAVHTTTLPFTRYLAGHADYTPVIFSDRRGNTTWANQVASAVILGAPLLTCAANPETILANPCVDMLKSIPAVWDQTIALPPSEIGKLAVFARRKGKTWFLAVMNGDKPQTIKIPLSFLGEGAYQVTYIKDKAADKVTTEHAQYKKEDTITVTLGEGGGYIARLEQ